MNFSRIFRDYWTIGILAFGGVSGGTELRANELKIEMDVMLPPFIVEQTAGPIWKYAKTSRFEILSRSSDTATRKLALAFHRSSQLLDLVLPPRFQLELDVPQTLIFYDEKNWSVSEQNAVAEFLKTKPFIRSRGTSSEYVPLRVQIEPFLVARPKNSPSKSAPSSSFFKNLMLTDADSIFVFALASERMIDPKKFYLTPAYVRTHLGSRVPALPDWFIRGFMGIYGRMEFRGATVRSKPIRTFLTSEESTGLKASLAFLFDEKRPSIEAARAWSIQSELFVSWGIDPQNDSVPAFWSFVERSCFEPITETLFKECFGFDFGEAAKQIDAHTAGSRGLRWDGPKDLIRHQTVILQDATPNEIARIKGEWERLEARFVRKNHSEYESQYVNLARRTLQKGIDRGERDPRLLVTLGLLELDAGNDSVAIPLLEEAVQQGVIRPRAYYELARLRYENLVGRSTRFDGRYPKEQSDYMLNMLLAAARQSPPLLPVYELLEHVSANSLEPPTPEVIAAIAQGAGFFPNRKANAQSPVRSSLESMEPPKIKNPVSVDWLR